MNKSIKDDFGQRKNKVEDRRKIVREELAVKEAMQSFDEQFSSIFKVSNQSAYQSAKTLK